MQTPVAEQLEEAIRRDGRYPPEAYEFLLRGLQHTTQAVHGDPPADAPRHVSGRQLCEGLRSLALQTWGPLAGAVLARWGIRTTRDFGEMVFVLTGLGVLGKQDSDRIEDFDAVYDFASAFEDYRIRVESAGD
jgi:uncharacterized repeat protein (TIGR04138 family)